MMWTFCTYTMDKMYLQCRHSVPYIHIIKMIYREKIPKGICLSPKASKQASVRASVNEEKDEKI